MSGVWRRTLVYLGLVEDDGYDDYGYDDYADEEPEEPRRQRREIKRSVVAEAERPARRDAVVRAMPSAPEAKFFRVSPRGFDSAKEIGDRFRDGYSVVMDFESTTPTDRRRILDFASGLAYGLDGSMQRIASQVVIIAPRGVQVSEGEGQRFLEEHGYFNQA